MQDALQVSCLQSVYKPNTSPRKRARLWWKILHHITYPGTTYVIYMQPATRVTLGSSTNNDTVMEDTSGEANKDDVLPPHIFFNFECMQETGAHAPTFCIAHKVCSQCLDQKDVKSCQRCGDRQSISYGPNTTREFCEWLFEERNAGAIVICHNFKGYDSYFITFTITSSYHRSY